MNEKKITYDVEKLENLFIGRHGIPVFDVDGRYKISVNIDGLNLPLTITCLFDAETVFNDSGISSGERLALKTWENNTLMFSIGTEDEIEGIEVKYLERGIKIDIEKGNAVDSVVFGVAWRYIKDYEKEKNYTWFAADPIYAM